jgi:2-methylcitrate dehydratase PrpD
VLVPEEVVKTVCEPQDLKRKPANSYEAQFSIPYLVSTALLKGSMSLEDLEEAALRDSEVLALAAKVHYKHDPDSGFPKYYSGEVIVELDDGTIKTEREAIHRGAVDRPLTAEDIIAKYRANVARERSVDYAGQIERSVLGLDSLSVSKLAQLLGQSK